MEERDACKIWPHPPLIMGGLIQHVVRILEKERMNQTKLNKLLSSEYLFRFASKPAGSNGLGFTANLKVKAITTETFFYNVE